MSLLPFFEWCESTALGAVIRDSLWLFPVIEVVHLLGLSLIGGAVLVVDLRLIGVGITGSAGGTNCQKCPALVDWQSIDDAGHGSPAVHVGVVKVLLQPPFLVENGVSLPGHHFYFHDSSQSDEGRRREAPVEQTGGPGLAVPVVRRGIRGKMDRVLLTTSGRSYEPIDVARWDQSHLSELRFRTSP